MTSCLSLLIAGIKVRVYCQVGKANQGSFALNVAVKTLELYKEYVLHSKLMQVFCFFFGNLFVLPPNLQSLGGQKL